jgi:hypothetical protein
VAEFRAQSHLEGELGLPLTPHMKGIGTTLEAAELQSGFCDYVLAPMWRALGDVFPSIQACVDPLEENSRRYKAIVATEKTAKAAAATAAAAAAAASTSMTLSAGSGETTLPTASVAK